MTIVKNELSPEASDRLHRLVAGWHREYGKQIAERKAAEAAESQQRIDDAS